VKRCAVEALILALSLYANTALAATPPRPGADLSGVWRRLGNDTARAQTIDVRGGPPPPLNATFKAEWEKTRERARQGFKVWDGAYHCLPQGTPRSMTGTYPFEILMTPGRVTILTESGAGNETRRIWIDGRGHPPQEELDPTYAGDSIGHWEGSTLVVDTVGLRYETQLDVSLLPHSDQLHVVERFSLVDKNHIDVLLTLEDPVVFTRPWVVMQHFDRAPKEEQVREAACAEGGFTEVFAPSPDDAKYDRPDPRLKTKP
jgi:hypothetical protein